MVSKASEAVRLAEDLRRISADTGLADQDLNALVSDEHERYEFYTKAFVLAPPPDDRTLLSLVLRDPDRAMGEAAAVEFINRQARQHASYQSFVSWAATVSGIIQGRDFLVRRIQEWSEFKSVIEGARLSRDSLEHFSDWLQRKLSDEAGSQEVLATLAEFGRTKRIRNTAKQRLKTI
ncbi:MAG: hypothetical protein WA895_04500 [Streptosporangiaceae bacterium]